MGLQLLQKNRQLIFKIYKEALQMRMSLRKWRR